MSIKLIEALADLDTTDYLKIYLCFARLIDEDYKIYMKGKPEISREEIKRRLPDWLIDKVDAFLQSEANTLAPHRHLDHAIDLEPGKRVPYQPPRPFSRQDLEVIAKFVRDNLQRKFIRPSKSEGSAPLILAKKPGGGVRICADYRRLNNITIKSRYPIPLVRETLNAICEAKHFTKVDIQQAFWRLRIREGDEYKTAFSTKYGQYE